MYASRPEMVENTPLLPESPLDALTFDGAGPAPFRLEEAPVYRDDWVRQHPHVHLLFHRDIITHLVWCAAACRYLTGGADGAVKLWRSELQPRSSSTQTSTASSSAGAAERPALIPELHVTSLGGPVTGLCVSDRIVGNSEVAVITSTDGTLTLCRTGTGEIIRALRGARGESLEPRGVMAAPSMAYTQHTGVAKDRAGDAGDDAAAAAAAAAAATSASLKLTRRSSKVPTWYAADAYSCRLAPSSDMAVVRRPVYTVRAYRDEAREVLTGSSNAYFQGLRAVAPTYEHLAPHEERNADVLAHFSVSPGAAGPAHTSTLPRQWYASAVALATAPSVVLTGSITNAAAAPSHTALDPFLLLGFPQGLVQVYVLPQRWFALHQHGETRRDPPVVRIPVFAARLHSAAVLKIEVIVRRDLMISISEDGTTQLRRLSCLRAPLRQLGVAVALPTPLSCVRSPSLTGTPARAAAPSRQRVGSAEGHSRLVTCCCIDAEQQLLVTGGADHTLCWWSLMAGSSSTPSRIVSLRDTAGPRGGADGAASAMPGPPSTVTRGGYPVDVSLFRRKLLAECHDDAAAPRDTVGGTASHSPQMVLFLLVLDTERVVRIFDAVSGKLVACEAELRTAAAIAAASAGVLERSVKELRLARYDCVNGADRVLLGGPCLLPWYLAHGTESGATRGHTAPIIFTAWCASLGCAVTADAHHVLLWRLRAVRHRDPTAMVLRAWRIAAGIRAIALCDARMSAEPSNERRPTLFIAHASEPTIVQYDCLVRDSSPLALADAGSLPQPQIVRRLALQTIVDGAGVAVDSLAAASSQPPTRRDAGDNGAVAVEGSTAYVLAVCHATRGSGADELCDGTKDGSLYLYALRHATAATAVGSGSGSSDSRSRVTVDIDAAAEMPAPLRELRLSGSRADDSGSMASVLCLPRASVLLMGGRRVLYTTPLASMTSSAIPCEVLPATWATTQQSSWRGPSASARALQPTAVFPGPLLALADASSAGGRAGDGEAEAEAVAAAEAEAQPFGDSALTGYLSRLVSIPNDAEEGDDDDAAVCLVLSGSNDGLVQLWDVRHGRELWQCRAVLAREPITALTVQQCAKLWLVAVGDQSGVVTLLDITSVVQAARQVVAADAQALRKSVTSHAEWTRQGLECGEARMVDRWLAHADAVAGAFFTVPAMCGKEGSAAAVADTQLVTTGEDSAVMVWELPSWVLLSPATPANEHSGIPLFRPGERADTHNRRRPNASARVHPSTTKLPWAAKQAYEPWRQQYVRQRLLLSSKSTDLAAALTRFYSRSKARGDPVAAAAAAAAAAGTARPAPDLGGGESEEESRLIDCAWAVLTADARALAQSLPPVEHRHDAAAIPGVPETCTRAGTVVQSWCVSLLQDTDTELSAVAPSSSQCGAKHLSRRDNDADSLSFASVTPSSATSGAAGKMAVVSPTPLVLAFADRCCDGHASGARHAERRGPEPQAAAASAASVRECLRQAIRAVLHGAAKRVPAQRVSGVSASAQQQQQQQQQRRRSTVVGRSLSPSVTDAFLFTSKTTIAPPLPSSVSDVEPGGMEVAESDLSRTTPAGASLSTAPGDYPAGLTPSNAVHTGAHRASTPRRHVGFAEDGICSQQSQSQSQSQSLAPMASASPQSPRLPVTYRVGYGAHAPLVRAASADHTAGMASARRRLLRDTAPRDAGDGAVGMGTSVAVTRLPDRTLTDDDGDGDGTDMVAGADDSGAEAQCAGLAGGGVSAIVMQHANRHRRREEALQRLMTLEQADLELCRRGQPADASVSGRPTVSGGSVALGLAQCSVRRVSMSAPRWGRQQVAGKAAPSQQGRQAQAVVLTPLPAPQVLLADTYLTPVLARVGASSALLPGSAPLPRTVTSATAASSNTGVSTAPASTSDSAQSTWYAERQRRRDVAHEKARLWNSQRVMHTVLRWSAPAVEDGGRAAAAAGTAATPRKDGDGIITLDLPAAPDEESPVAEGQAVVLSLPPILHLHSPGSQSLSPTTGAAATEARSSPNAAALTALLYVSPTTAIDAAVRQGLPSRKALQAEMTAAKVRMRQSVHARAAHQREYRAMAASVLSTHAPSPAPMPAAGEDSDSTENLDEVFGSGHLGTLDDADEAGSRSDNEANVSYRSHDKQGLSRQTISVAASIAPLGKSGCSPRRALQPHEGAEPRRMATVPLPTATTRQELFGSPISRRRR